MESGPTGDITAEFAPTPPSDSPVRPRAAAHSQPLRTLNHLISGLVHDFNVVLQTIQNTYGLLERVPEGSGREFALEQGRRAVGRAVHLLERLALATGGEVSVPQLNDPAQILREMP